MSAPLELPDSSAIISAMSQSDFITLTDAARSHAERFLARDGAPAMRLALSKTGCSGWAHEVYPAQTIAESDIVSEDGGITVVVAKDIWPMVKGTRIDFVRKGLNTVFEFHNPQVTDACGCGESVAIAV